MEAPNRTDDDAVVGRTARMLRLGLGLTQADVAARVRRAGCFGWNGPTVAKIELGERQLRLAELGCLSAALEVTSAELLAGTSVAALDASRPDWAALEAETAQEHRADRGDALERRLANRLGVSVAEVQAAAVALYGGSLIDVRDAQLEDEWKPATDRERATALGHITRGLINELRDYLNPSTENTSRSKP